MNTALITEINYSLTHIHIKKTAVWDRNNISQFLLYFCSNKYSFGEPFFQKQ